MEVTNMASLPTDVLHVIFTQISDGGDDFPRFSTLYRCIVSSKHLANSGAVTALICNDAPVKGGGNEALSLAEQGQNVQRWAILWRTIILSSLDKTLFPYCRNLRLLDLRDLNDLLTDDKFRGKIVKTFFDGGLAQFHLTAPNPATGRQARLATTKILRAVGDSIIAQAPLLEGLWEPTTSDLLIDALSDWAPRLSHLRRLDVWNGKVFANQTTRNLLHAHCPHLDSLGMFTNTSEDADIADFIRGMPSNKLNYFENQSSCRIGQETCLALSAQGQSLRTLKLYLSEEGIMAMGLLQGCTALRELAVASERPAPDMKATQNDVYLDVLEWLKNCHELRKVSFVNLISAPDLALPILQNENVCLESLDISGKDEGMYVASQNHPFHQALTQQDLRTLHLKAEPDPTSRDDVEALVNALCSLTGLQDLRLLRISDYFNDEHLQTLIRYLPNLQDLTVGGYGISDTTLLELAQLQQLKSVSFSGITTFTTEGIVQFVDMLRDSNAGLSLAVDSADPDSGISTEDQDMIRGLIQTKVDGRFEYQLLRDPNAPEFDSDDWD